jgi:hypothetical protein
MKTTTTFKTIEIMVSPTGEMSLKAQGFTGRECLEATRQLEAALGRKLGDRLTGEFYAARHQQTDNQLHARGEES